MNTSEETSPVMGDGVLREEKTPSSAYQVKMVSYIVSPSQQPMPGRFVYAATRGIFWHGGLFIGIGTPVYVLEVL